MMMMMMMMLCFQIMQLSAMVHAWNGLCMRSDWVRVTYGSSGPFCAGQSAWKRMRPFLRKSVVGRGKITLSVAKVRNFTHGREKWICRSLEGPEKKRRNWFVEN